MLKKSLLFSLLAILLLVSACSESPVALEDEGGVALESGLAPGGDLAASKTASFQNAQGYTNCPWGSADCNPTIRSISELKDWNIATQSLAYNATVKEQWPTWSIFTIPNPHWQGIQRLMVNGGKYLAMSRSGSDYDNGIVIVEMGSRTGNGNRFNNNAANGVLPLTDKVISSIPYPTSQHKHAGGMQAIGNYLAVAHEEFRQNSPGVYARVDLYDVSDPYNPQLTYTRPLGFPLWENHAGSVAITKLSSGQYLMAVYRYPDKLSFFRTQGTSLNNPQFQYINTKNVNVGSSGWENFQNTNFLTDDDGTIWFVGMWNTEDHPDWGRNYTSIFPLLYDSGSDDYAIGPRLGDKRRYDLSSKCHFDAGSGYYVAANSYLVMYCLPHDGVYSKFAPEHNLQFSYFTTNYGYFSYYGVLREYTLTAPGSGNSGGNGAPGCEECW